uniref:Family with sequence similarity 113 n=1 Tax=Sphenodon punctatus TaxID=8508 RepID=A0A8D0LC42_SPHPU
AELCFQSAEPRCAGAMVNFQAKEVQQLLHNKFVVILGDSIQRSVYKDLVTLLQKEDLTSSAQLRLKVPSEGPEPDLVLVNSCIWDLTRYHDGSPIYQYRLNLEKTFRRFSEVLPDECLVIWTSTMPLGPKTSGSLFEDSEHPTLRNDVIEANFYSAVLAKDRCFDVLDLHYHFRFDVWNRTKDGVHWNNVVHRKITHLLLEHVADAWGVEIPKKRPQEGDGGGLQARPWPLTPSMPLRGPAAQRVPPPGPRKVQCPNAAAAEPSSLPSRPMSSWRRKPSLLLAPGR